MLLNDATFQIGERILHRRYGYRGVVVGIDQECKAPDEWYYRNQTQPDRDQPWYHIFVHGGRETYVAEENLLLDPTDQPIEHPRLGEFFPTFLHGRYYRQSLN